jgi:hypothetical protein
VEGGRVEGEVDWEGDERGGDDVLVDVLVVVGGVSGNGDFTTIDGRGEVVWASRVGYSRPLITGNVSNNAVAIAPGGLVVFADRTGDELRTCIELLIRLRDLPSGL